jgi:hypothetical protein
MRVCLPFLLFLEWCLATILNKFSPTTLFSVLQRGAPFSNKISLTKLSSRTTRWFKRTGQRNDIFLATKFASRVAPDGPRKVRNDPDYIREACDKSLRRRGVDHIDLYYCHHVDANIPIEQTVGVMAELKKAGKVKYLGLSECSADTLRRACTVEHIVAVQIEYSPFTMDIEDPADRAHGCLPRAGCCHRGLQPSRPWFLDWRAGIAG